MLLAGLARIQIIMALGSKACTLNCTLEYDEMPHNNDITCLLTCGCLFFILPTGWFGKHEIEFSKMGKISINYDMVCKNKCSWQNYHGMGE